jgi:hypothetical protein
LILALVAAPALAQGTDQPPAQRDLMIISEWLGRSEQSVRTYDSIEQAYFEGRKLKEGGNEKDAIRFPRQSFRLVRGADEALTFTVVRSRSNESWAFTVDTAGDAVRLHRIGPADTLAGSTDPRCDILIRREAGQFAGRTSQGCAKPAGIAITQQAIWEGPGLEASGWTRYRLAREFQCFVDVPGVGGGRNIPYKRYGPFPVLDQGGTARFTTQETPPRTLEIKLRNVAWGYNNAPGQFTRNSLTMYISTIDAAGVPTEGAYAFAEPTAQRLGVNLKHLLANCAIVPLERAKPEF